WTIPDCGPSFAILADSARQDRRRARCECRSDKTASTTAIRQMPGVEHCERHPKYHLEPVTRRTRRLLCAARRRWTPTLDPVVPASALRPVRVLLPTCEQFSVCDPLAANAG